VDDSVLTKDDIDKLREVTEIYLRIKKLILFAEESDKELAANPQTLIELRNSLDHLMRVAAVAFGIQEKENEGYIQTNIDSVRGHLYRAGFDTLDWLSIGVRLDVTDLLEHFSPQTISIAEPEYFPKKKIFFEGLAKEISEIRNRKDIGNINLAELDNYIKLINQAIIYQQQIEIKIPSMEEIERKNEEKFKKQSNIARRDAIIIAIMGAIIGGLVLYIFLK